MIWTLIRKEMLEQISSLRFSISAILATLFLVPSTYMLAIDYGWLHREMGPLVKESFWTEEGSRSGWYYLHRDIPTLRVLSTGLDQELTLRCGMTGWSFPNFDNRKVVHNPLRYLFSHLDFVFFINIVGSLLAFAFTYDAISGERERGTLRLMMTHPISRPLFLLSKFIGSYTSFVITLLPALIGVVLVLHLHPDVNFRASDWGATCTFFLLATLYISAFFMLGLFVSCVTKEPKITLTALLTLWVLLVLLIPNFSPFLAAKLRPVPSAHEIEAQIVAIKENRGLHKRQVRKRANDFGSC